MSARGRPRKVRPAFGADLDGWTSLRDVEAATGIKRRDAARFMRIASIPAEELERLFAAARQSNIPVTSAQVDFLARRRAGKRTEYVRCCSHCGKPLRI